MSPPFTSCHDQRVLPRLNVCLALTCHAVGETHRSRHHCCSHVDSSEKEGAGAAGSQEKEAIRKSAAQHPGLPHERGGYGETAWGPHGAGDARCQVGASIYSYGNARLHLPLVMGNLGLHTTLLVSAVVQCLPQWPSCGGPCIIAVRVVPPSLTRILTREPSSSCLPLPPDHAVVQHGAHKAAGECDGSTQAGQ